MDITKEFLEDRMRNFDAELMRLEADRNHVRGMRDACFALLEHLEKPPEGPKE
jgi:uncharacterized small protein (DUF1192 family)